MPVVSEANLEFWGAGTPRTLRAIWTAEELGLDYVFHPIGPRTGETQTPEYTALTPKQKVPLMVEGDFCLTESIAIARYLVDAHPNEAFWRPASARERAREDEWITFAYGELDETALYVMRRHGDLGPIYGASPAVVEASRAYAERMLAVVGRALASRRWLVGDGFGLADLIMVTCLDWAHAYEAAVPEAARAWRGEIAKRDAYRRAQHINAGKES